MLNLRKYYASPRITLSFIMARASGSMDGNQLSMTMPESQVSLLRSSSQKTPADEGLDFFASVPSQGESPIRVYELRLDPDGGPNNDCQVSVPASFLTDE